MRLIFPICPGMEWEPRPPSYFLLPMIMFRWKWPKEKYAADIICKNMLQLLVELCPSGVACRMRARSSGFLRRVRLSLEPEKSKVWLSWRETESPKPSLAVLGAAIPNVVTPAISHTLTPEFICSFIHFELALWQLGLRVS